jgi:hypothetical protein
MPTPAAGQREDRVIELVIADLLRSGCTATLVDRPDRNSDRIDGLTVDAELAIDEERWALEVTTLRWRQGLEGAVQKLESRLAKEFGAQLEAVGRTLTLTCHVSTDERVVRALVELVRAAVVSGQNQQRGDEAASLWPWAPELGALVVQPWLSQTANVREEIVLSSGDALGKKLRRQLSRARALGYRTCLALDQRGSTDLKFGANFLPLPDTIVAAVAEVEADAGDSLDALVLIREDDRVDWIRR